MTRDVYLIVYHSPLFPAHWGLWIPTPDNPDVGKVIHVVGDAATGFAHELKRNYSRTSTQRKHSLVLLATVEAQHVVDGRGDGALVIDTDAVDEIERKALAIPAPGKSLNSSSHLTKKKVEIQNCQTWLHQLVAALVADRIFPDSAIVALSSARKN